jgi:acyl-coenzyme A synthetase/AMP-(fatty) acid ligase
MNAAESLLSVGRDDAFALECGEEKITYSELRQAVSRAADAWHTLGLKPEGRTVIFANDGIDWGIAYLGAIWAGGVAIGVNPRLSLTDFGAILRDSEIGYVWTNPELAPALAQLAGTLDTPPQVVVAGDNPGCIDWSAVQSSAHYAAPVPREEESPALWIGTSGTTGTSKGVIHPQRVVINAQAFAAGILGVTAADRLYATSKFFFAYALGNSLFAGLGLGATVIIDQEWPTPERVLAMVERHQPTILFSVPTLYSKIVQSGLAPKLANRGIRHFVSAGETMPVAVSRAGRDSVGSFPISGYGTSETLCLMLYCADDSGQMQLTPRTEVRYNLEFPTDIPQRIWVRAPTVAQGYWRRPDAQADSFAEGWFSPGDMFLRKDHGRLEFAGRHDDLLKISGQWVSTQWIEHAVIEVCGDALVQLAAVGAPTTEGLTAIAILAVSAPGQDVEARQRLDRGIALLPKHRRPRWVHWVKELPMTATGKLQRGLLRKIHEEQLPVTSGLA